MRQHLITHKPVTIINADNGTKIIPFNYKTLIDLEYINKTQEINHNIDLNSRGTFTKNITYPTLDSSLTYIAVITLHYNDTYSDTVEMRAFLENSSFSIQHEELDLIITKNSNNISINLRKIGYKKITIEKIYGFNTIKVPAGTLITREYEGKKFVRKIIVGDLYTGQYYGEYGCDSGDHNDPYAYNGTSLQLYYACGTRTLYGPDCSTYEHDNSVECHCIKHANGLWVLGTEYSIRFSPTFYTGYNMNNYSSKSVTGTLSTGASYRLMNWKTLAYGDGVWAAIPTSCNKSEYWFNVANIYTSKDNFATIDNSNVGATYTDVCFGNGIFVAPYEYGVLRFTKDMVDSQGYLDVDDFGNGIGVKCLTKVTYAKGIFISYSNCTKVDSDFNDLSLTGLTWSTDGYNWTQSNISGKNFYEVKFSNNTWLALCEDGLYRSADGKTWTKTLDSSITTSSGCRLCGLDYMWILYTPNGVYESSDNVNWVTLQGSTFNGYNEHLSPNSLAIYYNNKLAGHRHNVYGTVTQPLKWYAPLGYSYVKSRRGRYL